MLLCPARLPCYGYYILISPYLVHCQRSLLLQLALPSSCCYTLPVQAFPNVTMASLATVEHALLFRCYTLLSTLSLPIHALPFYYLLSTYSSPFLSFQLNPLPSRSPNTRSPFLYPPFFSFHALPSFTLSQHTSIPTGYSQDVIFKGINTCILPLFHIKRS